MVSRDDQSEYLDFSYNFNDRDGLWWALMPDYDRNVHVLGFMNRLSSARSDVDYIYDQKNSKHRNRKLDNGKPAGIYPIIFSEIPKRTAEDVVIN